jgi:hypothetical protein
MKVSRRNLTDLEGLLSGAIDNWSLPPQVWVDDIIFFYLTKTSMQSIRRAKRRQDRNETSRYITYSVASRCSSDVPPAASP